MRIKAFILCFCSLLWLCSGCFAEENIETNNSPVKMTPSAKDNREMSTASPASEAPSSAPESPTSLTPTTEPAVTDSHPFSPLPSELPHESPMPGDYDYIPPVSGMDFSAPGIYEIAENTTYSVDFDNDGVFVTLTIRNTTYTSDWLRGYDVVQIMSSGDYWIEHGAETLDLDISSTFGLSNIFVMRRNDGSAALLVGASNAWDYPHTYIFTMKEGLLSEVDSIRLSIKELRFDSMDVEGAIHEFLGNQFIFGTVSLTEDFMIIYPEDGWFGVLNDEFQYTALIELQLKRIVGGEFVNDTLLAGTRLRSVNIDIGFTRTILEDTDGNQWLLAPEEDFPPKKSNGFWGDEVFDGCIHAGG